MSILKNYYELSADEICKEVKLAFEDKKFFIEGIGLVVYPHVYPSHEFRTTSFVLKNLEKIVNGKKVCDMGCGPGIVGLYSLKNGAKKVVQADINPHAIENANKNNELNGYNKEQVQVYLSNCFDNIPMQKFDLIVFNMPYHDEVVKIVDPLQLAFYDPGFASIKKFLSQAKKYSNNDSVILIAFSNKGNVEGLEKLFDIYQYKWELWKITNTDQTYDNRIYKLKI